MKAMKLTYGLLYTGNCLQFTIFASHSSEVEYWKGIQEKAEEVNSA
jgi:hypothetical protein